MSLVWMILFKSLLIYKKIKNKKEENAKVLAREACKLEWLKVRA